MDLKQRAKKLKTDIPAIFLALRQPDTPALAKIVAGIAIVYALSPIDLIPDYIPVLGYLDDVLLLPALIALTIRMLPDDILDRCRQMSETAWENERSKKWYYAIPTVLIWIFLALILLKIVVFR